MGKQFYIQSAFNAGEWSSRLDGQVELKKYPSACRVLENFILYPHGGAHTRPGFRFINAARFGNALCRLTPFIYSNVQAYILEWGKHYLRFYKDRGRIEVDGVPVEIATPYIADDLALLQFAQSADVVYCVHRSYPPRKLTRASHTSWTIPAMTVEDGPWRDINKDSTLFVRAIADDSTIVSGSFASQVTSGLSTAIPKGATVDLYASYRYGLKTFGTTSDVEGVALAALTASFPYAGFQFTPSLSGELNQATFEIVSAASSTCASRVKLYSDSSGSPGTLIATSEDVDISSIGEKAYTFPDDTDVTKDTAYWLVLECDSPSNVITLATVAANSIYGSGHASTRAGITDSLGVDWKCSVSYVPQGAAEIWDESHIGALWRLKHTGGSQKQRFLGAGTTSTPLLLRGKFTVDLTPYVPVTEDDGDYWDGEIVLQSSTDLVYWENVASFFYSTMQEFFEADSNVWYRLKCQKHTAGKTTATITQAEHWGTVKITSYISKHHVRGTVLFPVAKEAFTPTWRESAWSDYRGWPNTVVFHDDRLWFARDDFVWASWSGDYENFTPGDTDNAPVTFELTQFNNPIEWILSHTQFMCGSIGEEGKIGGGTDKPITQTNVLVKVQSIHGSAQYPKPIRVGPAILFVETARRKLRELVYDYVYDSFQAADLTVLSEHISEGGITDIAYQKEPDSILWCVRADGVLLGFTYYRDQDVLGWHRHITDGEFESVAVIPSSLGLEAGYDELWAVVKRIVNGKTKRYVELLDNHETVTDQEDYFCVDSGLTYDGAATTTFSGMNHLERKTVAIVADGVVVSEQVVKNGAFTLDSAASVVHAGLPFTCTLQTMRIEPGDREGTTQGRRKQILRVVFRFLKSLGGKVGPSLNDLRVIPYWKPGVQKLGEQAPLFTGDMTVEWPQSDNEGRITIVQDQPLPLTVLAAMPLVMVND